MGCRGQQRRLSHGGASTHRDRERSEAAAGRPEVKRSSYVYFQYVGRTGLSVIGPMSGKRYRFDRHGATIPADPRDRRSLAAVPGLRQARNPSR